MASPLSLRRFYFRNKRKIVPVIGILALAVLGIVVEDSLLASARETAYATYGSYQKLILVAPRPTREQDLAAPLQDSLVRLEDVQAQVGGLDGPSGLAGYYDAVAAVPLQLQAELPRFAQLQRDAQNARYYAARLRGDLAPLALLIVRIQRAEAEAQALLALEQQLSANPSDPTPLISYLQQHRTFLTSLLPNATSLGQLQAAVIASSSDAAGLQQALASLSQDAAQLDTAAARIPALPPLPNADQALGPFRAALDRLTASLNAFQTPESDVEQLQAASQQLPSTAFAVRDAISNLNINLLAGQAQFDLYGVDQAGMDRLLALYGDHLKAGRLPQPNANEIVLSEEIARARRVAIGGKVGNAVDELDELPDSFTVVGIVEGPVRLGLIPFDYMTQHYLFERRYEALLVSPRPGQADALHAQLAGLVAGKPFRLWDWPYIKGKIDSLISNLDTINRFLVLLVTLVLSLVVGLLNNLFFRQRMNEFGLLAALGHTRLSLIRRVAMESLGIIAAAWVVGIALGILVLWWFNQAFMIPHGLLLNVFDWQLIASHTLPLFVMVFAFGMGTVGWQLIRLDPIAIIERRD